MRFDLTDLALLRAIGDEQSLTRGAEKVFLSTSSASIRIKQFEARLGLPLLRRTPQGMVLTEPGERVYEAAANVEETLRRLKQDLEPWQATHQLSVRVVGNHGAMHNYVPGYVAKFLKLSPESEVKLYQRASDEVVRWVDKGKADIGIGVSHSMPPSLVRIPFKEDQLALLVSVHHPLATRQTIAFEETFAWPLLSVSPQLNPMQAFFWEKAKALGYVPKPLLEVDTIEMMCRLVADNLGVAWGSAYSVLGQSQVRAIALKDAWAERRLDIFVRQNAVLTQSAARFLDLLQSEARQ